ncbi:MAG: AAA family ATPase [Candidatus Margulisbacteria bacterium]|nr:AAA family ATPase [Candidatus Margulisiibacteriota bacterium]
MKIKTMRIENFRSFKDETIEFDNYNCFVGSNGAGKSTVLNALNVFFRESKDTKTNLISLTEEDFHHKNITDPIKITITFIDLSKAAQETLSAYYRLNELTITAKAIFDKESGIATINQYGNRLAIKDFSKYFEADKAGSKVGALQAIYQSFCSQYIELPNVKTKGDMVEALQNYEQDHPKECLLIESPDQFYGFSGISKLHPYLQWIFVSASKDIIQECEETKSSALGQLLLRTVRSKVNFKEKIDQITERSQLEYKTMIDAEQPLLEQLSDSLMNRLKSWAHPETSIKVLWKQDPAKSVKILEPWAYIKIGERGFEGELARFGLGLQRSYMLALLQELAISETETGPTLLLGIEEPEIYQHPPQAKYLSDVLYDLSQQGAQLFLCSHSPQFIPGDKFETVRLVRDSGNPSCSNVYKLTYKELANELNLAGEKLYSESGMVAKLYSVLNPTINEIFFCKKIILVEGLEDMAYITTYLLLTENLNKFRSAGCHIVNVNSKSNLIKPIALAKLLNIPFYVICDADTDKDQIKDEDNRKSQVGKHKKDNKSIQILMNLKTIEEWPLADVITTNLTMWKTNITKTVIDDFSETVFNSFLNEAEKKYGDAGNLRKNPLIIATALCLAWEKEKKSDKLIELINRICKFAEN